jgi:cell division protein FtsI (penicillin-binding protein 3)
MRNAGTAANLRRRMAIARLALVVAFLGLAARAAHLSVLDERGENLGEAQLGSVLLLPPERGGIFDRNGFELALSVDAPSIYAIPRSLEDPRAAARALAGALDRDAKYFARRLTSKSSFVFLARWVSQEQAAQVQTLGLRGIGIVHEPRRTYPTGPLAPQLVGFANIDGNGVRGIEQAEDAWLRGTPRRLPVERDGSGHLLVGHGNEYWSTAGGDVALTLDVTVQSEALLALNDTLERTGAKSGIVVSLDPHSGDILALAEAPSFDPNGFRKLRFQDTRARAFLDALEPGSTFKAFLIAAALADGAVRPDDLIDCEEGEYRIPGMTIRDHHPHGMLSLREILQVSSNIGAVKVAYALGPAAHVAALRRLGFGAPTRSGFPEESAGVLRDLNGNRPVDHATLAYGQGTGVTPVQLAVATAVLANGGRWIRPRVIAARRPAGGTWQPAPPSDEHRVFEPEVARNVVSMLESVTQTGGTARLAALRGISVAGKTGTAQKWDFEAGKYSKQRFVAWFIGIAPADDPRVVIVVAVDEPRRPLHTGGAAAAPLFARVAAAQLARFGIMTAPEPAPLPTRPDVRVAKAPSKPLAPPAAPVAVARPAVAAAPPPAAAQRTPVPAPERLIPEVMRLSNRLLLPDLAGLTVAQVKAVTAKVDLLVEISGRGRAVAQSPPAGTIIASDALVVVRFEPGADSI